MQFLIDDPHEPSIITLQLTNLTFSMSQSDLIRTFEPSIKRSLTLVVESKIIFLELRIVPNPEPINDLP